MLVTVIGLAAVALSTHVIAEDRPQAVLDLIAGHQALAMKIRPLQDRVTMAAASQERDSRFNTDGVPARADVKVRLSAFDTSARTERERIMRPKFGVGLSKRHKDIISAQKKLSALQRELAALEREINAQKR